MTFDHGSPSLKIDCGMCVRGALLFAAAGAVTLCSVATVQYIWVLGTQPIFKNYIIPAIVGGMGGAVIGVSYTKLRLYAQGLAHREAELTAVFHAAHNVSLITFALDGNEPSIATFSNGAQDIFGYLEEEIVGHNGFELCVPAEKERLSEIFRKMRHHRQGFVGDLLMLKKTGGAFPAFFSLHPIVDKDGFLTSALGVAIDMTAQKLTEAALQEAEARLKTIFDSVHIGLMVVDAETQTVVEANEMASRMVGIPKVSMIGSSCRKYFCPDKEFCPITQLGHSVDNAERVLVDARGREIPILKTVVSVVIGARTYLLESFIDISDRKKAEEALRTSHEFSATVLNSMNDAVCIVDVKDLRLQSVNSVFLQEFGLREEETVGKTCFETIHRRISPCSGDDHFCPLQQTIATGAFAQGCHEHVNQKGETIYVEISASPVMDRDGKVSKVVLVSRNVTERRRAEQEIEQLAYYDTLTRLPNRLLFRERLNSALMAAQREHSLVGVFFLDLDRFKAVNDTLGHSIGDELLKVTSERLQSCVRRSDTVARLGGDEFVIMQPSVRSEDEITMMAQRILSVLAVKVHLGPQEIYSTGSIGIAVFPTDGRDVDTLLKNADLAMYQAKEQGRNTYEYFSRDMNLKAVERLALEASMRRGLERREFALHYQPQYDLRSGKIVGVEALVRWNHPELGLLSPLKFITLAEETGLIIPLGEWVLRTACVQAKKWYDGGLLPIRVAVNISPHQFKQQDFSVVEDILTSTGLPPSCLELELTESTLMENAVRTVDKLKRLKSLGIQLTVDDFGTGYSSLNYLKHFPLDRIKIAQSFVRDIGSNPDDSAITEAIIKMAHSLKLKVIAEGVETLEQLDFLRVRHCDEVQGFYFSKPLLPEEFEELASMPQGCTA